VLWAWFVLFGILPAILFAVQIGSFAAGGLPTGDIESVAESVDDFGALEWATALLNVAAAVVWVRFVRQLTNRHKQLTNEI
jgi:membrane protein implicated in regulation of membrane protease activity